MEAEVIEIKPETPKPKCGVNFARGAFAFTIAFFAEEGAKKAWDIGKKMIKARAV